MNFKKMNKNIIKLKESSNLKIIWAGNNGWILGNKDYFIATDLVLEEPNFIKSNEIVPTDLKDLKILFITHEHDDHFNSRTCKDLIQSSNCIFVIPSTCVPKAKVIEIPDERLVVVYPGNEYTYESVNFKVIRAFHGHLKGTIYRNASPFDCGYIFQLSNLRIYQPGDTVLLQEHLNMDKIDILFFSSTEHNTHIDNSIKLIELLNPRMIIPQHFGTYITNENNTFWTTGFPDEVYSKLSSEHQSRFKKLYVGEMIEINL